MIGPPSRIDVSVVVVEADPKVRTRLALQLADRRPESFGSVASAAENLGDRPAVLVLGPSAATDSGLAHYEKATSAASRLACVLVVEALESGLLRRALRAGVTDVVTLPLDEHELSEAVARAVARVPAAPSVAAATTAPSDRGRLITVFSTKGGAGKSFAATNLAVLLARRSDRPVVLVDADLQFGDVAVMLGLSPAHTIVDAVSHADLEPELLRGLLIEHEPSGLLVLPAPIEPAFADAVTAAGMTSVLDVLREIAAYVVVDTSTQFNEVMLALLEASDEIVVMAGVDVPLIKNTKIGLQTLRLLNIPGSKLKLVVNRANSKVRVDVADVERTLQLKADCLLPSDIAVPQSINKAIPVVLDSPRSGVARALDRLVDLLVVARPTKG